MNFYDGAFGNTTQYQYLWQYQIASKLFEGLESKIFCVWRHLALFSMLNQPLTLQANMGLLDMVQNDQNNIVGIYDWIANKLFKFWHKCVSCDPI